MISVFLVVKNEEKNLERVLKSIVGFDDIVIVDSGSTDNTIQIARQYTGRVYEQEWLGMARQKDFAKHLCKHDWVLNLDGDEELTPALREEINWIVASGDYVGASLPFQEYFLGKKIHSKTKQNRHLRLFRKSLGEYGHEMDHESLHIEGEVARAVNVVNHYGEISVAVKVDKINRYSSSKAQEKFEKGKKSSLLKLILVFPLMFSKSYFLRRNFLNGRRGFISSIVNAFYAFLKEAKLYEKEVINDKIH